MARSRDKVAVYLEIGKKRVFAGTLDWPGWCRSGRDEESALQALREYRTRYSRVVRPTGLEFPEVADVAAFAVVERLKGDATTDFGAPGAAPSGDKAPVSEAELKRFQSLLKASWRAFDAAATAGTGKELTKGPRGGGRELEVIVQHVLGGDEGYLSRLAWKPKKGEANDPTRQLAERRKEVLEALETAVTHGVPARGPRGGVMWTPRYFVRRVAWHVLDHAWEIEDRIPKSRSR